MSTERIEHAADDVMVTIRHEGGNTLRGTVAQVLSTHLAKGWVLESGPERRDSRPVTAPPNEREGVDEAMGVVLAAGYRISPSPAALTQPITDEMVELGLASWFENAPQSGVGAYESVSEYVKDRNRPRMRSALEAAVSVPTNLENRS